MGLHLQTPHILSYLVCNPQSHIYIITQLLYRALFSL